MTTTKSKKKYIKAWHDHLDSLKTLSMVDDEDLSFEVLAAVDQFKRLVERVADRKDLK